MPANYNFLILTDHAQLSSSSVKKLASSFIQSMACRVIEDSENFTYKANSAYRNFIKFSGACQ